VDRLAHVDFRLAATGDSRVKRVAVIGAGWSGLACALELVDQGVHATLLDAAPQVGGRARRVDVALGDRVFPLDNGQHILLGGCVETLRLMQRAGIDFQSAVSRQPFELRYADGFRLAAWRFPAPLHLAFGLLFARGLSWRDRVAMVRWVQRQQLAKWLIDGDRPAARLFADQPAALVDRIWEPLCLAALNVRLVEASAQIFLNVLRDSVGANAAASDLLLVRTDLSALFPEAAVSMIQRLGGSVRLRTDVDVLERASHAGWRVVARDFSLEVDAVVLALPPPRAKALLDSAGDGALAPALAQLGALSMAPIATVYLRYAAPLVLPAPFLALREDPARQDFGQWIFDRWAFDTRCACVASVVVSGDGPHMQLTQEELARSVERQLSEQLGLPASAARETITEKRATIVPRPGLARPPTRLPCSGLYLAGDAAESPYPSTIEGSVRSGIAAAGALLHDIKI